MVFGIRLFGSSNPDNEVVEANAPRKADRVEGAGVLPNGSSTTEVSIADSDETIDIPLEQALEGPDGGGIATEALGPQFSGRDSTATARLSTFSAFTVGGRSSTATVVPSISVMMNQSSAALNARENEGVQPGNNSSIPLTAIPDFVLSEHPQLKLAEYSLARRNMCSNAIAMPHNACRLEMSDMWSYILPSLTSRPIETLTRDDAHDLQAWWGGFIRFSLTTSLVDDLLMARAYKDIVADFDKDAQLIKLANRKFEEKNTVTLEIVSRAMGKAVELFCEHMTSKHLTQVIAAWRNLSMTLCDIYTLVEKTLNDVDKWRRNEAKAHKDLEKKIVRVYTNRRRWGSDDSKRGEMVVLLTRWVDNEHVMREWMQRNLSKRELRCIDRWMDEYRASRLHLIESFNQRHPL